MCAAAGGVSVGSGAMTVAAVMPLVAISVLAWVMIGLPILLVAGGASRISWGAGGPPRTSSGRSRRRDPTPAGRAVPPAGSRVRERHAGRLGHPRALRRAIGRATGPDRRRGQRRAEADRAGVRPLCRCALARHGPARR